MWVSLSAAYVVHAASNVGPSGKSQGYNPKQLFLPAKQQVTVHRTRMSGTEQLILAVVAKPDVYLALYSSSVFFLAFTMSGWARVSSLVPNRMLSAASTPNIMEWSWLATSYL